MCAARLSDNGELPIGRLRVAQRMSNNGGAGGVARGGSRRAQATGPASPPAPPPATSRALRDLVERLRLEAVGLEAHTGGGLSIGRLDEAEDLAGLLVDPVVPACPGPGRVGPMPSPLLADAFGHHVWATIRVLDACAALDEAQKATAVPGTYGSIIDTLRHLVGGDVFYLDVLRSEREPFAEAASDIPTLRTVMVAHDAAWQHLIAGPLDPESDVVEYEDSGWETHAPLGIRLAQALYHGTDHRSQVCTALTSIGIEPPAIEVWDYAKRDGRMSARRTGIAPRP